MPNTPVEGLSRPADPGPGRLILSQNFGSASYKATEHDRLGRTTRQLAIDSLPAVDGRQPFVLDLDELEWMAGHGETPELAPGVGEQCAIDPCAVLLHALLPGKFVVGVHSDALCALADMPDAAVKIESAFGGDVRWSPRPSSTAEVASLAAADERPLMIAQLGLFISGGSRPGLDAQADKIDELARSFLDASRPGSANAFTSVLEPGGRAATTIGSGVPSVDDERLLAAVRGLVSVPHRVVLALSESATSYSANPALERLVETAAALEPDSALTGISLIADLESARKALARPADRRCRALFIPTLGLLGVGCDEVEAQAQLRSAAHRLAVASIVLAREVSAKEDVPKAKLPDAPLSKDQPVAIEPRSAAEAAGPLAGRVYIVTGAASGIGRDIARHLSFLGAALCLADISGESLNATAEELTRNGVRPLAISGDLTDEAVVDRVVSMAVRRFGGVDGAVLNAGVAIPGQITQLSAKDWRRSLEVNSTSHFLLSKRLLPVLIAQGIGGSLVFIGSKNMFSPGAGFGAYSASKAALAQLARTVAIESGSEGIRSNIVNPDNVFAGSLLWSPETRAQRAAVYGIRPEDLETYYTQRNLLKVPISGHDVAKGVAFLLSDDACRTTACVLTVDGGVPGVFPR